MIFSFDELFKTTNYPSGEWHIEALNVNLDADDVVICNARNFDDLMKAKIGIDIQSSFGFKMEWVIPYFPFARDDRRNSHLSGQELYRAVQLFDNKIVHCVDPHSEMSAQLGHYPQSEVVLEFINHGLFDDVEVIAIPDAGAAKKAYTWATKYHALYPQDIDIVQCLKKRDTSTGKLSGFQVVDPEKVRGRNVVIVDDICDGGGTFIGLARELASAGATDLRLAITHGLFTKGLKDLFAYFREIYTLDIYNQYKTEFHTSRIKYGYLQNIIERGNIT
jgi:ribose-phosphate pyrophosphokinase